MQHIHSNTVLQLNPLPRCTEQFGFSSCLMLGSALWPRGARDLWLMKDVGEGYVPSPRSLFSTPEVHHRQSQSELHLRQVGGWRAWFMRRDGKSSNCLAQQKLKVKRRWS